MGGVGDGASLVSDVPAILARARRLGESPWRVGIALGVDRSELERLEQEIDTAAAPKGAHRPNDPAR